MRTLMLMMAVLFSSASAYAQTLDPVPSPCLPVAARGQVVVTRVNGTSVKDTLLCMGRDEVQLAAAGRVPLDSIQRIATPRDGVLDGMLKGASVGLVMLAFCVPYCDARDAGNNTTIYTKGESSVALQIRF